MWVQSADGLVAFRCWAAEGTIGAKSPIVLEGEIKNMGNVPRTFLRPFGDTYLTHTQGIELIGPQGKLSYTGSTFSYALGANAFAELAPGESIRDQLTIPKEAFANSDMMGRYKVTCRYIAISNVRPPGLANWNLWIGEVAAPPIDIIKQ